MRESLADSGNRTVVYEFELAEPEEEHLEELLELLTMQGGIIGGSVR